MHSRGNRKGSIYKILLCKLGIGCLLNNVEHTRPILCLSIYKENQHNFELLDSDWLTKVRVLWEARLLSEQYHSNL